MTRVNYSGRGVPAWRARRRLLVGTLVASLCAVASGGQLPAPMGLSDAISRDGAADPLPSWRDGEARRRLTGWVERVTREGGPEYVAPAERIAVFDNDGTLWAEQPVYFQAMFVVDRIKALAPQHPEWKVTEPYRAVLEGDTQALAAAGEPAVLQLLAATHSGMPIEEFTATVTQWMQSARHPVTKRRYTEMVYQPMLEVLTYLRQRGFKPFIVSGGGVEFIRPWAEHTYGIPPEQIVGSRTQLRYEVRDGTGVVVKQPHVDLNDDKAGKPVGIAQLIGRRPLIAFGNSDGDFEMLEYVTTGSGPRLGVLLHHTDDGREWAYDRASHVGRLARALDEAPTRHWLVVDMKRDWRTIYPTPP